MTYYIGIDGGGSNLRVAVVADDLTIVREIHRSKANPNVIGRATSTALIQATLREVLANFDEPIRAVGIGISGAPNTIAADWLTQTVHGVLPDCLVVPSSDEEIALVGAHSERLGVLVLAGTGSIAFGVNEAGDSISVGGWGYLMDDVGSGFWLGKQALMTYVRQWEGTETRPSALFERVTQHLGFPSGIHVIPWLYKSNPPETHEIAKLAPMVLQEAENGDWKALQIIDIGAEELALLAKTIMRRLNLPQARIAFAGSLLTNPTILAQRVCEKLDLPTFPKPDHSALIGAALLAKITVQQG